MVVGCFGLSLVVRIIQSAMRRTVGSTSGLFFTALRRYLA